MSTTATYNNDSNNNNSHSAQTVASVTANRRGSSMFAYEDLNNSSGPYGRPSYLFQPGDLLVDFPSHRDSAGNTSYQGDDCSDYAMAPSEPSQVGGNTVRLSEAQRMEQLVNSQSLPGGENYRPMVGGFAAAAYEAAREHHYTMKRMKEEPQQIPKDRAVRPSI